MTTFFFCTVVSYVGGIQYVLVFIPKEIKANEVENNFSASDHATAAATVYLIGCGGKLIIVPPHQEKGMYLHTNVQLSLNQMVS